MLTITVEHDGPNHTKDYEWVIGKPIPQFQVRKVIEIVATDKELDYINLYFTNIPTCHGSKSCWYGDLARTLYLNLKGD